MARDQRAMSRSGHVRSLRQRRREGVLPFPHWQENSLPSPTKECSCKTMGMCFIALKHFIFFFC